MDDRVNLWGGLPDKAKPHPMAKRPWVRNREPGSPPRPWNPIAMDGRDGSTPRQFARASPSGANSSSPRATPIDARRIRIVTLVLLVLLAALVTMH